MGARQVTLRIQPPVPLGDVTVVPAGLSGRRADRGGIFKHLRRSFPAAPLGARVAALGVIMERLRRSS